MAEAVPIALSKGLNVALKKVLGGSRTERLIRELMPIIDEIGESGRLLEENLREEMRNRPGDELTAHLPDTLELNLRDELLRDSPEEYRERRCGEVEKSVLKHLGDRKSVELIDGLTLDTQAQWQIHLTDKLRLSLCEQMRKRLADELQIALAPETRKAIAAAAAREFPADAADDMARAVVSRTENALRGPVSELFFKPLTAKYKQRLEDGETLDDILPEAFATCRLASQLVTKTPGETPKPMRHFDVQLIGGIVLHQGKIAEMVTGEGKTLVATLPAYLNALSGKGVHVITTNSFLARRDAAWMGPLYRFLGLTVGYLRHEAPIAEKHAAYGADITYGTNDEFGFDYLRDNMKTSRRQQVQRPLNYAIVDEVDNILVDEARTPLIISGMPEESTDKYYKANAVAQRLKPIQDYEVKEKEHTVTLTEQGIVHAQELLGVESFYSGENVDWPHHMNQALAAKELYRRDRDYVVKSGEVIIVDEFTGRMMPGRRWSDGLHQAVEASERLSIKQETQTLATITYQNFFRMYNKLSGMTGTALTEAEEFDKIYGLDVVPIPTNKPLRRLSFPDVIYATKKEKYEAIVDEIARVNASGRPALVGTIAIEVSEHLSQMLDRRGIKHKVLNAKYHESEAAIIARAGEPDAVTIATNMAGRGTDIVLGEGVVACRKCILRGERTPEPGDKPADVCRDVNFDPDKTVTGISAIPCGLHIVGTERHESRRIDNQLRGRAGRQGDPGSSRFFLSLEDDLMRVFMGEWVRGFMARAGFGNGQEIESPMVSRAIGRAQKKVEQYNFEIRKNLLEYDEVMDGQRGVVYGMRQKVLDAMDPIEIHSAVERLVKRFIAARFLDGNQLELVTRRTFEPLQKKLETLGVHISEEEWLAADEKEFARLVRERADAKKVQFDDEHVRSWIQQSLDSWLPDARHPSTWDFAAVAQWCLSHGINLQEGQLRENAERPLSELIVAKAAAEVEGAAPGDYLREWTAAALMIDLPLLSRGAPWGYDQARQWAGKVGIGVSPAEWDPISRKRDRQEELLAGKLMQAHEGRTAAQIVEEVTPVLLEMYCRSEGFLADPRPERVALWAQRRVGAHVNPDDIREAVAVQKRKVIARVMEGREAAVKAGQSSGAAEMALMEVERYLADDLAAAERNLRGIASAFAARYGVELPLFEMSKMSADELIAFLAGRVPPEIKYEIDVTPVREMVFEMIDKSIGRAVNQFVSENASPDAAYARIQPWLESQGFEIGREQWRNLSLHEVGETLGLQARKLFAEADKDAVVEQFVPQAIETFLDSPLFAGEAGYSALATWAQGQFSFGISDTMDADLRKFGEQRRAELREKLVQEKTEAFEAATDDAAEASAEMVGEAIDVYFDATAASDEFDEMAVANWASKAFKLSPSHSELESRVEAGQSAVREYLVELAQKAYGRQKIGKIAGDAVDAILALCTTKDFVENWDYDLLSTWMRASRLPMNYDVGDFESETRSALVGYFTGLAKRGYKERAKEEVVPGVVANAAWIAIGCELSAEGRDYRTLAATMNQKFGLGVSPFRLSSMRCSEAEQWLKAAVRQSFRQRERELGQYASLRSIAVLVLHTLDTRWKDHLYAMDHLKSGIGLRGYAGVDPKDAYKKEGYEMFTKMLTSAEESISEMALRVHFDDEQSSRMVRREPADERYVHEEAATFNRGREQAAASAGKDEKPQPIRSQHTPGRNDPCPCGRKKPDGTPVKYKNCCMKK